VSKFQIERNGMLTMEALTSKGSKYEYQPGSQAAFGHLHMHTGEHV